MRGDLRHCLNLLIIFILFISCRQKNNDVSVIKQETLFEFGYGNFSNEVNLFSMRDIGDICTGLAMQDGFFFIVNGESQKIMKTNSYGDILSIFYNSDYYEKMGNKIPLVDNKNLWHPVDMPFKYTGKIASDKGLRFFVVASAPRDKTIHLQEDNLQLEQVVIAISGDEEQNANKALYIGCEGEGGNPFPFIKNITVTENGELVVVCVTNDGLEVFWYTRDYDLRYKVLLRKADIPNVLYGDDEASSAAIIMLENVAPDPHEDKLFVKVDYYMPLLDSDTGMQNGIDYTETLVYPFDVKKAVFGDSISIPPFTQSVYSKATGNTIYKLPYEFLGVTKSGTLFFMTTTIDGFNVEAVHGNKILKRNILVNHDDVIYYSFNLASSGIVSALLAYKDKVTVNWWRCDEFLGE